MRLLSKISALDEALGGGLPVGGLTEWGMPMGREARPLLLAFLRALTHKATNSLVLWVDNHKDLRVFPPAFYAHGIKPECLVFTTSKAALKELRPALLRPLFKVIVLDTTEKFTIKDCLFLSRCARQNHQSIVLLRNFFLSNRHGNIAACLRINAWRNSHSNYWTLQVIKGPSRASTTVCIKWI